MFSGFYTSWPTPCIGISAEIEAVPSSSKKDTANRGSDQNPGQTESKQQIRGFKMKNNTATQAKHRLSEPLYWKPLATSSNQHGEYAGNRAFVSLPAWPGYRDAGTPAPLNVQTTCPPPPASDDTDPPRELG